MTLILQMEFILLCINLSLFETCVSHLITTMLRGRGRDLIAVLTKCEWIPQLEYKLQFDNDISKKRGNCMRQPSKGFKFFSHNKTSSLVHVPYGPTWVAHARPFLRQRVRILVDKGLLTLDQQNVGLLRCP